MNLSDRIRLNTIKNSIKIICGLPPNRPTDEELDCILDILSEIEDFDLIDEIDFKNIVIQCVGPTKKYIYEGLDNSDIIMLLQQISKYLSK